MLNQGISKKQKKKFKKLPKNFSTSLTPHLGKKGLVVVMNRALNYFAGS